MAILGSSYYRSVGANEVTGPTGNTGETGPTGPTGPEVTGTIGSSGGRITGISKSSTGPQLETFFTSTDNSVDVYKTFTSTVGPTGNTHTLIYGGNTGSSGGVAVFSVQNSPTEITIRSIEGTGDSLSVTESDTNDTINIHFDRGNFGYINATAGSIGQFVGGGNPYYGITGATYSNGSSNIKIKSYKENSKYLLYGEGLTFDFSRNNSGTGYILNLDGNASGGLNPNNFGFIEIDMTQVEGFDSVVGSTGPIYPIDISPAIFGYTGNSFEDNVGKSFTLIVKGATYGIQNNFQFQNTIWPYDRQPCFSGGEDIFNFFWLPCDKREVEGEGTYCPEEYAWYGNIVQWYSSETVVIEGTTADCFFCNDSEIPFAEMLYYPEGQTNFDFTQNMLFGTTGATGACCRGGGECVHTISKLCSGYFHGAGTTCGITSGSTGSVCFNNGSCCIIYNSSKEIDCINDMSVDECINMGELLDVDTIFGGVDVKCIDMNCTDASKDVGACCDGRGGCKQTTNVECSRMGNFFRGLGSVCDLDDGTSVCYGGTGACCFSGGTCGNGITGSVCIDGGNIYSGIGTDCLDIECSSDSDYGCSSLIKGLDLKPGDEYAGGVVVGLYRPFGSSLFGSSSFGKGKDALWDELMVGSTANLSNEIYYSKYDYHGYGFTSEKGCSKYKPLAIDDETSTPDAYYIIVSPSPIAITGDREVVSITEYPGATHEFYWGNRYSSWGPLYNPDTGKPSPINDKDVQGTYSGSGAFTIPVQNNLLEGYWYNQNIGEQSLDILGSNTFTSCKKARSMGSGYNKKLHTKPNQTAHGLWNRNWGIYNTIRIIGSDNHLFGAGALAQALTGLTSDYIPAFRATRLLDDNLKTVDGETGENPPEVSSWYIPSQDELSYIAANCIKDGPYSINLNAELLKHGGVPIEGWHWSSTGAFDESKGITGSSGEGVIIQNGNTADAGTLAWAMRFDENGNINNFFTGKKNRTQDTYKVRPIRMIRCDGKYAESDQGNSKFWKLPKVSRDSDQDINQ